MNKFMEFIFHQRMLRIAVGSRGKVRANEIRALHFQKWNSRNTSDLGFWFFRTYDKRNSDEFFASKREAVVWAVLGGTLPDRNTPMCLLLF